MAALSFSASVSSGKILASVEPKVSSRRSQALNLQCNVAKNESEIALPVMTASRRRLLAAGVMAPALVAGLQSEPAYAADLIQQKQRGVFRGVLKDKLLEAVEANIELVPDFLRLALNDAATYDKATKTGGANGSIRFKEELSRPENKGLDKPLAILEGVKKEIDAEFEGKGGPITYADLIQFAGQAAAKSTFLASATKKAGGDFLKGRYLYLAIGSAGNWGFFEKQLGRKDADGPDPAGRVPVWSDLSATEIKEAFVKLGLRPPQVPTIAPFLGSDVDEVYAKLEQDNELARYVNRYRESQKTISETSYQVDLISTFAKLSLLGVRIDTEAYSYKSNILTSRTN